MKGIRVFLLLCYSVGTNSLITQPSFPNPEDGTYWHMSFTPEQSDNPKPYLAGHYFLEVDTLICEELWSPVTFLDFSTNEASREGYILSDQERVFYTRTASCAQKNYLLYDFSLKVGDSAYVASPLTQLPVDTVLVLVRNITSTVFFGQERNIFTLQYDSAVPLIGDAILFWIEGIGNIENPFNAFRTNSFLTNQSLACVLENNQIIYSAAPDLCDSATRQSDILYVNASNGTGENDGTSWKNAFISLQSALDIALSGDQIWVAAGVYFPSDTNNRQSSFHVRNGVKLFGGFRGNEESFEQRNYQRYISVLSGDIGRKDDASDNCYHVIYAKDVDSSTVIDGFTIQYGAAIPDELGGGRLDFERGGGLYLEATNINQPLDPKVKNCIFINNQALEGGAIFCDGSRLENRFCMPILENCQFVNNQALTFGGGAIAKIGGSYSGRPSIIRDCSFDSNSAKQNGGAILLNAPFNELIITSTIFSNNQSSTAGGAISIRGGNVALAEFDISQCEFRNNTAPLGGALFSLFSNTSEDSVLSNKVSFKIAESIFSGNQSLTDFGGAIFLEQGKSSAQILIESSDFHSNFGSSGGGGIFISNTFNSIADLKVIQSRFYNNSSGPPGGGAIQYRGFLNGPMRGEIQIYNSVFAHNTGAILLLAGTGSADAKIINNTLYQNGMFPLVKDVADQTEILIANSIIWEEDAGDIQSIFNNNVSGRNNLSGYHLTHLALPQQNCAELGEDFCSESSIIFQDPLFKNPTQYDFRLVSCSNIINKGNNAVADSFQIHSDILGNPRIMDSMVDLGAFEQRQISLAGVYTVEHDQAATEGYDGKITVDTVTGGTAPFEFSWNNGVFDAVNSNLAAGNYILTITDSNRCELVDTITVDFLTKTYLLSSNSIKADLFPNQVYPGDVLNLKIESPRSENWMVEIVDVTGKIHYSKNIQSVEGNSTISIFSPNLSSGLYFLVLSKKKNPQHKRVFKFLLM